MRPGGHPDAARVLAAPRGGQLARGASRPAAAGVSSAVHASPPSPRCRCDRLASLRWVAEQGAVRVDVLAHVLDPTRPRSPAHARHVVRSWRVAGLVEHERRLADRPGVLWATPAGRRRVGLPGRADRPALGLLPHLHAVTLVRLGVERRGGRDWRSERTLHRERPTRDAHVADARFSTPDGVVTAVEVELTRKGAARLVAIVDELTLEFERVLYVVAGEGVRAAVAAAVERLGVEDRVVIADVAAFALA